MLPAFADEGAVMGFSAMRTNKTSRPARRYQCRDSLLIDTRLHIQARPRRADLPRIKKYAVMGALNDVLNVRIVKRDHGRLTAQFERQVSHIFNRSLTHLLADRRGTDRPGNRGGGSREARSPLLVRRMTRSAAQDVLGAPVSHLLEGV